jgi:hypothetical protein
VSVHHPTAEVPALALCAALTPAATYIVYAQRSLLCTPQVSAGDTDRGGSGGVSSTDGGEDGDGVDDLKRFLLERTAPRPWRVASDRSSDMTAAERVSEVSLMPNCAALVVHLAGCTC